MDNAEGKTRKRATVAQLENRLQRLKVQIEIEKAKRALRKVKR